MIVADTVAASPEVDTGKVTEVAPWATITDAGTLAAVLVVDKLINDPPGPAGPLRLRVAVVEFPPTRVEVAIVSDCSAEGVIVSVAVCVDPATVAVTVTGVTADTPTVFMLKLTELCPLLIMIDAGNVAAELLEVRESVAELAPNGEASFTVPVVDAPALTFNWVNDSDAIGG